MSLKLADKDILESLAHLEFAAEMSAEALGERSHEAQAVTTFRRLAREAGYDVPTDFDWRDYRLDTE